MERDSRQLSFEKKKKKIHINISPTKNSLALYLCIAKGKLSVNDSSYMIMCSPFVQTLKLSLLGDS